MAEKVGFDPETGRHLEAAPVYKQEDPASLEDGEWRLAEGRVTSHWYVSLSTKLNVLSTWKLKVLVRCCDWQKYLHAVISHTHPSRGIYYTMVINSQLFTDDNFAVHSWQLLATGGQGVNATWETTWHPAGQVRPRQHPTMWVPLDCLKGAAYLDRHDWLLEQGSGSNRSSFLFPNTEKVIHEILLV